MWKKINYSHGCKFWIIFKQCKFTIYSLFTFNLVAGVSLVNCIFPTLWHWIETMIMEIRLAIAKQATGFIWIFTVFWRNFWIKRTEIFLLFSVEILDKKNWDFYCFLKEYRITNLKNTVTKRITQWLHRESFSSVLRRTLNKNYWDFYCFLKGTLDKNKNIVTKWMGIKERHIKIMDFFCIMKNLG